MNREVEPTEAEGSASMPETAPPRPVETPREDRRSFRRELTPAWAATVCLLAGERPIDLGALDVAYLGGRSSLTSAVTAATLPGAAVTTWNPRPAVIDEARRLQRAGGLENLHVITSAGLPASLGRRGLDRQDDGFDLVVVDGLFDVVRQTDRDHLVSLIGAVLRPGGLLCVAYRVAAGWTEVAVVVHLLQAMAARAPGSPQTTLPDAVAMLEQLRSDRAGFLVDRPLVGAWLEEAGSIPPDVLAADLELGLRPVSHALVSEALASLGVSSVGSADLTERFGHDLPPDTVPLVDAAATPVLRETIRDLARQATHRVDVFRAGSVPMPEEQRAEALADLMLVGTSEAAAGRKVDQPWSDAVRLLADGPVRVADLAGDDARAGDGAVRRLVQAGLAHPVVSLNPPDLAVEAADRLNAVIGAASVPAEQRVLAAPVIGSAVAASPRPSEALRARLRVGR
jgi:SAM-dependent methyltransferase